MQSLSSIGAALCLAGAGLCIHLVRTPRSCSAVLDFAQCDAVLSSGWAAVPLPWERAELPLAVVGLGYFAILLPWFVLLGWPGHGQHGWGRIPLALLMIGACASVGLTGIMAFHLQAWCGTCLAVHGLNALLAGLAWWRSPRSGGAPVSHSRLQPVPALATLTCGLALACGLGVAAVRAAPASTDVPQVRFDQTRRNDQFTRETTPVRPRTAGRLPKLSPGQSVSLSGQTLSGDRFDVRDAQGGPTLVVVWASRCGHCRQEALRLEALHHSLAGRGWRVIGVNLDRSRADAERFIAQQHLTWPQISAAENPALRTLVANLGITSIPKVLLIGSDGRLLAAADGVEELAAARPGEATAVPAISD